MDRQHKIPSPAEEVTTTAGDQTIKLLNSVLDGVPVLFNAGSGQPVGRTLSARERWLALQADAALRAAGALPADSILSRLEVNGLLPDTAPAYLYLRYQPKEGAPLEFWAGFRAKASLNLKRGLIGVPLADAPD